MMALAPRLGRQEAHHLVQRLARQAAAGNRSLRETALEDDATVSALGTDRIERALQPDGYLGVAGASIDKAVARWTRRTD